MDEEDAVLEKAREIQMQQETRTKNEALQQIQIIANEIGKRLACDAEGIGTVTRFPRYHKYAISINISKDPYLARWRLPDGQVLAYGHAKCYSQESFHLLPPDTPLNGPCAYYEDRDIFPPYLQNASQDEMEKVYLIQQKMDAGVVKVLSDLHQSRVFNPGCLLFLHKYEVSQDFLQDVTNALDEICKSPKGRYCVKAETKVVYSFDQN